MKKKKILVFGYFGFETGQLDGQTIKTRTVYDLLGQRLASSEYELDFFDTEVLRHGRRKLAGLFPKLFRCDTVVYMPAQNNLRQFFSILYFLSHLFRFEILYVMIGGWLPDLLRERKKLAGKIAKIKAVFPENKEVACRLEQDYGMKHVFMLPNFRSHTFQPVFSMPDFSARPFRLVFMSRIVREKGVETVFSVVGKIEAELPGRISVDFFGQVDPAFSAAFEQGLAKNPAACYRGVLQPDRIVSEIAAYDMLILPTFYPGEGFPGAVVEAYMAGLPVAVSDWKYNAEYVYEGETGFVVPIDERQVEAYAQHIRDLIACPEKLLEMKKRAFEESRRYTAEAAWSILGPFIEK